MSQGRAVTVVALVLAFTVTAGSLSGRHNPVPALESMSSLSAAEPQTATATIVGRVSDSATGLPVEAARVTRWQIGGSDSRQYEVLTDSRGRFLFRDVTPGQWRIIAELPGYLAGAYGRRRPNGPDRLVVAAPGAQVSDIVITLFKAESVLTGVVRDELGDPAANVVVRALRRNGDWRGGQPAFTVWPASVRTDDLGRYRIRLPPGDYAITAGPGRLFTVPIHQLPAQPAQSRGMRGSGVQVPDGPCIVSDRVCIFFSDMDAAGLPPRLSATGPARQVYQTAFVPELGSGASLIHVEPGKERTGADLQVRLVPAVRVSGRLSGIAGPMEGTTLRLISDAYAGLTRDTSVESAAALADRDGNFSFEGVAAGNYVLRVFEMPADSVTPSGVLAEGAPQGAVGGEPRLGFNEASTTRWADLPLTVGSVDVSNIEVRLAYGNTVSGRVRFDGAVGPPAVDLISKVSISLLPVDVSSRNVGPARVNREGTFTTGGYVPGKYMLTTVPPSGWVLVSGESRGRDLVSTPFDLQDGNLTDVVVTFTDKPASLSGSVLGSDDKPDRDATVLIFPRRFQDRQGFGAPVHRFREVRTGASGTFSLSAIPAGEYYVIAIDDQQVDNWQSVERLRKLVPSSTAVDLKPSDSRHLNLRVNVR